MALAFDNILRHVAEASPVDTTEAVPPRDLQAAEGSWRSLADVPEVEETADVSKSGKPRKAHQKRSSSSSQQQRPLEQQEHESSKKKQSSKKTSSSLQDSQQVPKLSVRDSPVQSPGLARDLGPVAEPPRTATPPQPSPPPSQRGPAAAAAAAAVAAAAAGGSSRGSAEGGLGSPGQRLHSAGTAAAAGTTSEWKRSKSEQRVRKNMPQQLSPLLAEQEPAAATSAGPAAATKSAMLRSTSHGGGGFPAAAATTLGGAKGGDAQARARRNKLMADLAFHEQQLAGLKGKQQGAAANAAAPRGGTSSSPLLTKTFQDPLRKSGKQQSSELAGEGIAEEAAERAAEPAALQAAHQQQQQQQSRAAEEDADDADDDSDEWSRDPSGFCFVEDFAVDGVPGDPQLTDVTRSGPEMLPSNPDVADGDWPDDPLDAEFPLDYVNSGSLSPDLDRTGASEPQVVLQEDVEEGDGEDEDDDEDELDGLPSALAQSSFARSPQSNSQPLQQLGSRQVPKPSLSPLPSPPTPSSSSSSSQPFDPFKPFQGKPKSKAPYDYKPLPTFEISGNIDHLFGLLNPGNPTLGSNRLSDPGLQRSNRLQDPGWPSKSQGLEDPGWPKREHGAYASMSTAAPRRSFLEEVGAWNPEDDVEPAEDTPKRELYPIRKPTLAKHAKEDGSKTQEKSDGALDKVKVFQQGSKKRPDETNNRSGRVSFDIFGGRGAEMGQDEEDQAEHEQHEDTFGILARKDSSGKGKNHDDDKPTLDYRTTYMNLRAQQSLSKNTDEEKIERSRQQQMDAFSASGSSKLTTEDDSEAKTGADTREDVNGFVAAAAAAAAAAARRTVESAKPIHAWESPKGAAEAAWRPDSRGSPSKTGVVKPAAVKVVRASASAGAVSPGSAPPPLPTLPASLLGGLGASASPPPMPALPSSLLAGPGAHKKGSSLV